MQNTAGAGGCTVMIYVFLLLALISFFDLKRLYKNSAKWQSVLVTLLFAGVIALCMLTAAGVQPKSPIVIVGDWMKSIGLAYPTLH